MTIALTPATLAHASLLAGIHTVCFADCWDADAMAQILSMAGTRGLIAVDGASLTPASQPPGPAGLVIWRTIADEAEILSICVLPPWRRKGLGQHLMQAALNQTLDNSMYLEVAADNMAAQALYSGMGFQVVGRRKAYYGTKDALVMRRSSGFSE